MADYKSTRNNEATPGQTQSFASFKAEQKNSQQDSSKKVAKVAAKGAATYFGGPAGGAAIDMAAKTKAGDKILNKGGEALNKIPGMAKAAKKLDDSGLVDKADQAIDIASAARGGAGSGASQGVKGAEAVTKTPEAGNATKASNGATANKGGSSSSGGGSSFFDNIGGPFGNKKDKNDDDNKEKDSVLDGKIKIPLVVKMAIVSMLPFFLLIILIVIIITAIGGAINDFTDAVGLSQFFNLPTGSYETENISDDGKKYFQRIKEVQAEFENNGKTIDPMLIMSVYHVANYYNHDIDYNYMTKDRIRTIANSMFDSDSTIYSEDKFRDNLKNKIFKSYFPEKNDETREKYVDDVFDYVNKYYEMIGYTPTSSCSPLGTCSYNIKGFYIYGKGSIQKNLTISNLKVRLMETGISDGHNYGGTSGRAMSGESLVDFEKYILGVAYQEIGPSAPEEAIKAQMVAARSYILARPTEMGGTLRQENGQWILQAANSTQDQVYCDPDQGCSASDGQWSMVHSGLTSGKVLKPALAANSRLRTLANETAGEVLVNSQGYVVYSDFTNEQQEQMIALAKKGYNYKQILLAIYNGSGSKALGASDIQKMLCNNSESSCANGVSGDIASWRQIRGPWINIPLGNSRNTIRSAGCLVTSIAIQVARSGVPINSQEEFNPGTFVQFLNQNGGFDSGGALTSYTLVTKLAPNFKYVGSTSVIGYSEQQKYNTLVDLLNKGYYVVAEVKKGNNSGQHWVAIVSAANGQVTMVDPASDYTILWQQKYPSAGTSRYVYWRVG